MKLEISDYLLKLIARAEGSNELLDPLIKLLFHILSTGVSTEYTDIFYKNFKKKGKINLVFIEECFKALKHCGFPISFDFPTTPISFVLTSFLSEAEAQAKIKNEIYEAGRFSNFPSYKTGYS